jgi:hypothetical protein
MEIEMALIYEHHDSIPPYQRVTFKDGEPNDDGSGRPRWSGDLEPPAIGTRVHKLLNNLGAGEVCGYFVEHGWMGILVYLDEKTRPAWHVKQCGTGSTPVHVFGVEFQLEPESARPRRHPAEF